MNRQGLRPCHPATGYQHCLLKTFRECPFLKMSKKFEISVHLPDKNLFTNGKSIPSSELQAEQQSEPYVVPVVVGRVVVAVSHTAVVGVVVPRAAAQNTVRAFGLYPVSKLIVFFRKSTVSAYCTNASRGITCCWYSYWFHFPDSKFSSHCAILVLNLILLRLFNFTW